MVYRAESHSAALALSSHCSRHYTALHPCVDTNVSPRATSDVCVCVRVCALQDSPRLTSCPSHIVAVAAFWTRATNLGSRLHRQCSHQCQGRTRVRVAVLRGSLVTWSNSLRCGGVTRWVGGCECGPRVLGLGVWLGQCLPDWVTVWISMYCICLLTLYRLYSTPTQPNSNTNTNNTFNHFHPEQSDAHSQESQEEYPEALRKEISDLQQALIDKFRGANKMVSGAQFRNSLGPGTHKCDACESKDSRWESDVIWDKLLFQSAICFPFFSLLIGGCSCYCFLDWLFQPQKGQRDYQIPSVSAVAGRRKTL